MTCPHCGAVAREENGRCAVCGGPRVHGGWGGDDAANALRETKTHLGAASRATALGVGFAVGAAFSFLFTVGVFLATSALLPHILVLAISAFLAFSAARGFARAKGANAKAGESRERAWLAAAEDVAKQRKDGVTAEELGKALAIEPARAEKLLTELAVHERTRIDVGDDAEVRYSVGPEMRLRVGDDDDESAYEALAKKKMELP
jgi:hypothetical protein